MKALLIALLLVAVSAPALAQDDPNGIRLNALVTVRISDLDQTVWPKVNARVAKEPNMNVEYVCTTTGILVLRMRSVMATERSDLITVVKRILHEAGVKGDIEFLDIHAEEGEGNKCQHLQRQHALFPISTWERRPVAHTRTV